MILSTISYAALDKNLYLKNKIIQKEIKSSKVLTHLKEQIKINKNNFNPTSRYILQFTGPINEEWKSELMEKGVKFYSYVPNYAFIVKIDGDIETITSYDFVEDILEYEPQYKVSDKVKTPTSTKGLHVASLEKVKLDILIFDPQDVNSVKEELENIGAEIIQVTRNKIRLKIDDSKTGLIANIPEVEWVEDTPEYKLTNDKAAPVMEAPTVWDTHGLTGAGQVVAVADSGLDTGVNDSTMHRDFFGRITGLFNWAGSNASDFTSGHGTHVAGSVLGNGTNSEGNITGTAPHANLVFQAVANDSGDINEGLSDLTNLYQQAYNASARIHTNSWGDGSNSYSSNSQNTDDFLWNITNFTIIFSAGNDGDGNNDGTGGIVNTVASQCSAKNVVCVGATENNRTEKGASGDNIQQVAYFSSRGPTQDKRVKPDIVAPGTFILSTRVNKSVYNSDPCSSWGAYNDFYTYCGGTSMSTPLVAGAVALIRQYFTDNQSITPSGALVKAALINGAQDIGYGIPSNHTGWGRVNITNSIFPAAPRVMMYVDNLTGLTTGQFFVKNYSVGNTATQLKITLVWTDYPSTPAAGTNLVNDLNLIVTSPNNTLYYGNDFTAPYNTSFDTLNNVEQVIVNVPLQGAYVIEVNASNIPNGPQPFGLVISGGLGPILTFVEPTPTNGTKLNTNYFYVNITSSVTLSTALLDNSTNNITMLGSGTNFYYNLTNLSKGNYTYRVYGNNSVGNWGFTESRYVETNNSAPNITSYFPATLNTTINETSNQTYNINYSDAEGNPVTVIWYLNGSNVSSLDNYTFVGNYTNAGLWNITVVVSDGYLSSTLEWNLTVLNVNLAPNITNYYPTNLTPNITEQQNITFNFTYDIVDTNGVTLLWYLNDSVVATGRDNYTFVGNYSNSGFYFVKAMVNDSELNSTVIWNLTVLNVNRLPTFQQISNITVNETGLVDINDTGELNATDPDGETLTYYYSSPLNSSGMWRTTLQSSGTYTTTVYASDSIGNSTYNVTITVLDVEDVDNDGSNNTEDKLTGNTSHLTSSLTSLNLTVDNSDNLSQSFNETKTVRLYNGTNLLVSFPFNFSVSSLDLRNVTINKQTSATKGGILIKGINLAIQNQNLAVKNYTKTVYMDNLSSQNSVCIEDAEIDSLSDISAGCTGANETLVVCDSTLTNGYNCSAVENGARYVISGLNHSGVNQQCGDADGDGYGTNCVLGSDCDDTDASKTTSCGSVTPSGGGGGGGGTSSAKTYPVALLAIDQTLEISTGDTISFALDKTSHSIVLYTIIGTTITLKISSSPFYVDINSGETKKIDVDKDGKEDIEVKAEKITTTKAKVWVKKAIALTCLDGIKNCHDGGCEVFTDCGGPCNPCETCADGIKNQNEEGVDCGGVCPVCTIVLDNVSEKPTITGAAVTSVPEETVEAKEKAITSLFKYLLWPLLVVVFFSVIYLIYLASKKIEQEIKAELEKFKVHIVHDDVDKLEQYIEHALEKGRSVKLIKKNLLNIGWSGKLINATLKTCILTLELKKHHVAEPHKEIDKLQAYIEHTMEKEDWTEEEIKAALIKHGWSAQLVSNLIRQYDVLQELEVHKVHLPSEDIKYLERYIEAAIEKGRDETEIKKSLKQVGWSSHLVHKAFKDKKIQKELEEHNVHTVHDKLGHLENYIKHALSIGRAEDEIHDILSKVGWKKEHVEERLKKVKR